MYDKHGTLRTASPTTMSTRMLVGGVVLNAPFAARRKNCIPFTTTAKKKKQR